MTVVPAQVAGVQANRCGLPASQRRTSRGGQSSWRYENRAASAARKRSRALAYGTKSDSTRGKNLWPGQSLRDRREATRQQRLRDRSARRTDRSNRSGRRRATRDGSQRTCWHRPSTRRMREASLSRRRSLGRQESKRRSRRNCSNSRERIRRMFRCQRTGAILLAPSIDAACEFVNRFAPEHLSLPGNAAALLKKCHAAGTIFLGPWAAQPLGDYASGSNHVLPTGGWARRRGGLSAADFVKCISVQSIGRRGFRATRGRRANAGPRRRTAGARQCRTVRQANAGARVSASP